MPAALNTSPAASPYELGIQEHEEQVPDLLFIQVRGHRRSTFQRVARVPQYFQSLFVLLVRQYRLGPERPACGRPPGCLQPSAVSPAPSGGGIGPFANRVAQTASSLRSASSLAFRCVTAELTILRRLVLCR